MKYCIAVVLCFMIVNENVKAQPQLYGVRRNNEFPLSGHIFKLYSQTGNYSRLHEWHTEGKNPSYNLVEYNGKLFGIAEGGKFNRGIIFSFNPFTNNYETVYHFENIEESGWGITLYNGLFYITSRLGGNFRLGRIATFNPDTKVLTRLYDFDSSSYTPHDRLTEFKGKLYGVTTNGSESIFSIDPVSRQLTFHFEFKDEINLPQKLIVFKNILIGTTWQGGNTDKGTLFSFDPEKKLYTKLVDFSPTSGSGVYPNGDIIEYQGKIYGTTFTGGSNPIKYGGTIFSFEPQNNNFKIHVEFPHDSMFTQIYHWKIHEGKFYGFSKSGTSIRSYDPISNKVTELFRGNLESGPVNGGTRMFHNLLEFNGKLFCTSYAGGTYDYGLIFSYDPENNVYKKLFDFNPSENFNDPQSKLTEINGTLFGFTSHYYETGYVYQLYSLNPKSNTYKVHLKTNQFHWAKGYHDFTITEYDKKLYGTGFSGDFKKGGIFSFDPSSNRLEHVFSFNGENGENPVYELRRYKDKLYGITSHGGKNGGGVLFSFNPTNKAYEKLYDFPSDPIDGYNFWSGNIIGKLIIWDDKIYGLTQKNGKNKLGTIFKFDLKTKIYSTLYDFDGKNGAFPTAGLEFFEGKLWGTTFGGGDSFVSISRPGVGIIFSFDLLGNSINKEYDFKNTGSIPFGRILFASDSLFYGSLSDRNDVRWGKAIYSFNPKNQSFKLIQQTPNGSPPIDQLVELKPCIPSNEVCDGMDNDCDGLIDEDITTPKREETLELCKGEKFELQSGHIINESGVYSDTLKNSLGCDSLVKTYNVIIKPAVKSEIFKKLCYGETYTLPSGREITATGVYIDTLAGTFGCDSIITTKIDVLLPLSLDLAGPQFVCAGQPVQITATGSGGIDSSYKYTWVGYNNNESILTLSPTKSVDIVLELTDGCTVLPARDTFRINVLPAVKAGFEPSVVKGCAPLTVQFKNTSSNLNDAIYQWNFGTGQSVDTSGDLNPAFVFSKEGTYIVSLAVNPGTDCSTFYIDTIDVYESSMPEIKGPASVCTGTDIKFSDIGKSSPGDQWLWDFGNGVTSNKNEPDLFQYNTAGRFIVKLTKTNAGGCAVTDEKEILIDELKASINASALQICDTGTVSFQAEVTSFFNTDLQYIWDFGNGNTTSLQNTSFVFNQPGTHPVQLTAASAYGCSIKVSENIRVISKVNASISGPPEICAGDEVQFTATTDITLISGWKWEFGNGKSSANALPPAQFYPVEGTYNIQAIAIFTEVCSDTAEFKLVVRPLPEPIIESDKKTLCRGESVQLLAKGGVEFEWTPSAGLSNPRIQNPKASPLQDTRYEVRISDQYGCSASESINLSVVQPINVSISENVQLCEGSTVQLDARGAASYQWMPSTGLNNSSIANPIAQPAFTTLYQVIGRDNENCFTDTAVVQVEVVPLPTVFAGNDTVLSAGTPLNLRPVTSIDVNKFSWSPPNFLDCPSCPAPISTPLEDIRYVLTVTNSAGCINSDDLRITVKCNADNVFLPNTFTPNGDGINDLFYPRGSGVRNVEYLRVFNRWGELVYERKDFAINDRNSAWNGALKGTALPAGVYLYTSAMICNSGERIQKNGSIAIIR